MSYKIVIYIIMLIFMVKKKFPFVSSEYFVELFFTNCITLSEKNISLHCVE